MKEVIRLMQPKRVTSKAELTACRERTCRVLK
jgi:hypothetical protein